MWIFLNNGFFSIVDHKRNDNKLTVRARFEDDINRVFPDEQVEYSAVRDYAYRAYIDRQKVADIISDNVLNINYSNFKNSVSEKWRHDAYAGVWTVMWKEQFLQEGKVPFTYDSEHNIF